MPAGDDGFAALGVPASLVEVLAAQGIVSPMPIQAASLPDSFAGRDILGRARTGSGKTLAYALVAVMALEDRKAAEPRRPRVLVLVPTRELAAQVSNTLRPLAAARRLRVTTLIGGVGQGPQVDALRRGVDIVVACPGRLEDLIDQRHCVLDRVAITVLDEADHLADLGFLPAVRRILDQTPAGGQRLLFSATLDNGVDLIVRRYLTDPAIHSVDAVTASIPTVIHHLLSVRTTDKGAVVRDLANGDGRVMLFTRTKHAAKKLALQLNKDGIRAVDLHGNLSQRARERNLSAFVSGTSRVLVATDVAARGIHVDAVQLVVHVDPPAEFKAYLHRSGRTARAGASGVVVTIATPDQEDHMRTIARHAGIRPIRTSVRPDHPLLRELRAGDPIEPVRSTGR